MSTVILDGGPKDGAKMNLLASTCEVAFPVISKRYVGADDQTRLAYYQRSDAKRDRFVFIGYHSPQ